MANRAYKRQEKVLAEYFKGNRTHQPGIDSPDAESSFFSVEAKGRKVVPKYLIDGIEQAERNATVGKLPVMVLHRQGQRHVNDLAIMRLSTFLEFALLMQDFYEWMAARQEEQHGPQ